MSLQQKPHHIYNDEAQIIDNTSSKRRRKPNQLYENDEITLFRDDILISRGKKRGCKPGKLSKNISEDTDYHGHHQHRQGKKSSSSGPSLKHHQLP